MDAIIAGQAFHWFDLDRAYPEFLRVLRRPGGVLAALWNTADDSVKWVAGLKEVDRSSVSAAQPPSGQIVVPTHPLFDEHEVERSTFPHRQRRTAESLTATIGTQSHTLVIPPEERAELLDRIMDSARAAGDGRGRIRPAHRHFGTANHPARRGLNGYLRRRNAQATTLPSPVRTRRTGSIASNCGVRQANSSSGLLTSAPPARPYADGIVQNSIEPRRK
ncbi:hypothetical protein [Nocardia exalbida]|uniref:hypothetical protein n=1 Tax=Nocardia exalbida TaxID=290231 RepID=UPI0002E9814F|nr:hypothetical protein [Nocardia exalbida]